MGMLAATSSAGSGPMCRDEWRLPHRCRCLPSGGASAVSQLRRSVSGALSRRALKDAGPPQEVLPQGDPRIDMLTNAVVRLERREDFAREIGALWKRAQATFLTIGQYLNQAKDRLPHGEFNAMIERDLPFGSKTAHQIRAASAAVQSGRLPAAQLPPNYTTLYYLSTLPD